MKVEYQDLIDSFEAAENLLHKWEIDTSQDSYEKQSMLEKLNCFISYISDLAYPV